MIANPSAQFRRPKKHVSLLAKPYERRCVAVVGGADACRLSPKLPAPQWILSEAKTFYTRAKVTQAVADGEMMWLDKFHNTAGFTESAAKTWMPMASDGFTVMQMVPGGAMF